jgi:hypothetical protein
MSPQLRGGTLSKREINLWTLDSVVFVAAYGTPLYSEAGYMPVVIIIGSMIGGLIACRWSTAPVQTDRLKVVRLYLLMLAFRSRGAAPSRG